MSFNLVVIETVVDDTDVNTSGMGRGWPGLSFTSDFLWRRLTRCAVAVPPAMYDAALCHLSGSSDVSSPAFNAVQLITKEYCDPV